MAVLSDVMKRSFFDKDATLTFPMLAGNLNVKLEDMLGGKSEK